VFSRGNIKVALTFVGTLIGAGFASGREIEAFFGRANLLSPMLASLFCAGLAYVFLELGRLSQGNALLLAFPKTNKVWDYLARFGSLVIFTAMLAGAEYVLNYAIGLRGGGIFAGLVALMCVSGGLNGIKKLNLIAVPVIILLVLVLFFLKPNFNAGGRTDLGSPVLYSSMNILTGGYLISRMGAGVKKKDSFFISLIIFLILALLMGLIYFAVRHSTHEMPTLEIAENHGLKYLGAVLIFLAIFTSMAGTLRVASAGNNYHAVLMLATSLGISGVGFANIVNYAYPVIGAVGAGMAVLCAIKLFSVKRKIRIK